jgi:hypothetical protein
MKNYKDEAFMSLMFFFTSCASTLKFPVSDVVPAADIVAKKNQDKNGNYKISVTAKNLAASERLNPPRSVYVVWIVTETEGVRSIGRLSIKNAKTASIETLTPFKFNEVFITAEDKEEISYPSGVEISRVSFKK